MWKCGGFIKQIRKKELVDIFGDKIDSKRNGWAGPRVDCDVSEVSNVRRENCGEPFFGRRGASQPPRHAPAFSLRDNFPPSSSVSIFTRPAGRGRRLGGLDGIIIDT